MRTMYSLFTLLFCMLLSQFASAENSDESDESNLFAVAQLSYEQAKTAQPKDQQKSFEQAVRWIKKFVEKEPDHPKAIEGYFMLAVSYSQLKQSSNAQRAYLQVFSRTQKGAIAGVVAFELAKAAYRDEEWESAVTYLQVAQSELVSKTQAARAMYLSAICYQQQGVVSEQVKVLKAVIQQQEASEYHIKAHLALAEIAESNQEDAKAYYHYEKVTHSPKLEMRAQVVLKCGFLAKRLGKNKEATSFFQRVLKTSSMSEWHARVALILAAEAHSQKQWSKAVRYERWGENKLSNEQKQQRVLLLAQSYTQLGKSKEAKRYYRQLARIARGTQLGFEAEYMIITSPHAQSSDEVLRSFLKTYASEEFDRKSYSNVQLLLAGQLFDRKLYQEALSIYQTLSLDLLENGNQAFVEFRIAIAHYELEQSKEAMLAAQSFLKKYPEHQSAPFVQLIYAELLAEQEQYEESLALLAQIVDGKNSLRIEKQALLLQAKLSTKVKRFELAMTCYQRLVDQYGKGAESSDLAEWHFWLGYAMFQEKEFSLAQQPLTISRTLDRKSFEVESTKFLAHVAFQLKNAEALLREIQRYETLNTTTSLPQRFYLYLALDEAVESRWQVAWKYFSRGFDSGAMGSHKDKVLMIYAETAMQTEQFEQLQTVTQFLKSRDLTAYSKAQNLYRSALASYYLKGAAEAEEDVAAAIRMNVVGGLKFKLLLLGGRIQFDLGDTREATRLLLQVAELSGVENRDEQKVALQYLIKLLEDRNDETGRAQRARYESLLNSQ